MSTITSGAERFLALSGANVLRDAAAKEITLGYEPFPKQREFHASPAKYRLFGGAAGPGKTKALLMEAILQAHEHPGANTLLLRRTFPELEQSLLLYFRRDVPRELYKSFNESKHVVTWQNNSTTRFGYCQSESDVYQYQGAEFLFIGIDELTLFTLRQWQFLTSRNRCPIPGAFPCMAGATNPGNIGHAWVKSLWIDKQPAPGMENAAEYDPADYDFISARVSDNPVYAQDENYLKTLRALPTHLRRAFLDGNWDVFAGQYFDNFDCSRHVLRAEQIGVIGSSVEARDFSPAKSSGPTDPSSLPQAVAEAQEGPPGRRLVEPGESVPERHSSSSIDANLAIGNWKPWWPRWISIDWGFEHPAAVYWHCAIPADFRSAGVSPANSNLRAPHPRSACEGGASDNDTCVDVTHSPAAPFGSSIVGARYIVPGDDPCLDAAHSSTVLAGSADVECGSEAAAFSAGARSGSMDEVSLAHETARASSRTPHGVPPQSCVVTYREFVTRRTTPRDLAHEIVRRSVQLGCHSEAGRFADGVEESAFRPDPAKNSRSLTHIREDRGWVRDDSSHVGGPVEAQGFSPAKNDEREAYSTLPKAVAEAPPQRHNSPVPSASPEKIDAIYLSPDAFAHRTGEASIAEQMGDVFAAAGLPRPVPADDDRVGGWMLMYQMLQTGEWLLTDNCFELIRTLPSLVRDPIRVEDVEKCDGDDPADAARYGLKSRYSAHRGDPGGWRSRMPLADRIASHAYSADPTIRAMQSRKFALEESGRIKPPQFERPRGPQRIPFRHGPPRRHQ